MAEKVLLVDDEQDFLDSLAERMRARGMDVSTTTSAEEAIRMAGTESYDAIVLDLMMPEMDGIEVLQAIKQKRPEVGVILLTGYASLDKGIQAMKLGAMDFVEKPADLKILSEKIKKAHAQKMVMAEKKLQEKLKRIIQEKSW